MNALRLIITGPRTWSDPWLVAKSIEQAVDEHDATEITLVHGGCPTGADKFTDDYAEHLGAWYDNAGRQLAVEAYPADWDSCGIECPPRPHRIRKRPGDIVHPGKLPDYCPGSGPRRNALVAAKGGHLCLAFIEPCANPRCRTPQPHDSHGTAGMIRICKRAGIPIRTIRPSVKPVLRAKGSF